MNNNLFLIIYIASLFGTYYITEKSYIRWTIKSFYDNNFLRELFVLIRLLIIILPYINTIYILMYSLLLIIPSLLMLIKEIFKK